MKIEDLKKELTDKQTLLKRTEILYNQLSGQIVLLEDLIKKEEVTKPAEEKKE